MMRIEALRRRAIEGIKKSSTPTPTIYTDLAINSSYQIASSTGAHLYVYSVTPNKTYTISSSSYQQTLRFAFALTDTHSIGTQLNNGASYTWTTNIQSGIQITIPSGMNYLFAYASLNTATISLI